MKRTLLILVVILSFCAPSFANDIENTFDKVLLQSIEKNEISNVNPEIISQAEEIMWARHHAKEYSEAIKTATYVIDLNKSYYGENDVHTGFAYAQRALFYSWYDVPQFSLKDIEKVDEILKLHPNNELKKRKLEALIHLKLMTEETLKTFKYSQEMLNLNKKGMSLIDLYNEQGNVYSILPDYENAIKYYNKDLALLNKSKNNEDVRKFYLYMQLARQYKNKGMYKPAEDNIRLAEQTLNKINDENNEKKIQLNFLKIEFNEEYNNINNVEELLAECKKLSDATEEKTMAEDIETSYMYYYKDRNEYKKFMETQKKLSEDKKNLPPESLYFIFKDEVKSEMYQNMRDYKSATDLELEALNKLEPIKDVVPAYYGKCLRQLFYISMKRKNPTLAKQYLEQIYDVYKQADTDQSYAFIDINRRFGEFYSRQNNHEEAIKSYTKALQLAQKYNSSKDKADLYGRIGFAYSKLNDAVNALNYGEKAISTAKEGNEEYNSAIYMRLLNKYYILSTLKRYDEADTLLANLEDNADKVTGNTRLFKRSLYTAKGWREMLHQNSEKALEYGNIALEYADHDWEKEDIYFMFYKAYKAQNNMKKAAKYKKMANL
jgi:tetratricopeptide (TPR) repeat protein